MKKKLGTITFSNYNSFLRYINTNTNFNYFNTFNKNKLNDLKINFTENKINNYIMFNTNYNDFDNDDDEDEDDDDDEDELLKSINLYNNNDYYYDDNIIDEDIIDEDIDIFN